MGCRDGLCRRAEVLCGPHSPGPPVGVAFFCASWSYFTFAVVRGRGFVYVRKSRVEHLECDLYRVPRVALRKKARLDAKWAVVKCAQIQKFEPTRRTYDKRLGRTTLVERRKRSKRKSALTRQKESALAPIGFLAENTIAAWLAPTATYPRASHGRTNSPRPIEMAPPQVMPLRRIVGPSCLVCQPGDTRSRERPSCSHTGTHTGIRAHVSDPHAVQLVSCCM